MSRLTIETPIVFEQGQQKLFGFLIMPEGIDTVPAVALFDGMGGSSHGPRRMFTQLARRLGGEAIAVLRFSFRGHGDSEGDYKDVTVESMLSDAQAALAFLMCQPGVDRTRLGVVGMSLGGLVAANVAGSHEGIRALVLWSAVAHNGDRVDTWLTPAQKAQLQRDGYYDDIGVAVNRTFFEQLRTMNGTEMVSSYKGQALILHGTADAAVPLEDACRYKQALGDRAKLVVIDGANHAFPSLLWEQAVLQHTVTFLRDHLRG